MNINFNIYLNSITDHIEKHIGKIAIVYDEIRSDELHIDVHHVPPQKNRPWHTYITSGMGAIPMKIRKDFPTPNRAELIIYLSAMGSLFHIKRIRIILIAMAKNLNLTTSRHILNRILIDLKCGYFVL